ncbi:hypothetical protein Tco_1194170 [Tanacetum coccineum]
MRFVEIVGNYHDTRPSLTFIEEIATGSGIRDLDHYSSKNFRMLLIGAWSEKPMIGGLRRWKDKKLKNLEISFQCENGIRGVLCRTPTFCNPIKRKWKEKKFDGGVRTYFLELKPSNQASTVDLQVSWLGSWGKVMGMGEVSLEITMAMLLSQEVKTLTLRYCKV